MALIDRLVNTLVESEVPLERESVTIAARALLAEEAPLAGPELATAVTDALVGLGPVEALLRDPYVSDVLVNGPDEIWVERSGRLERSSLRFANGSAVVER